MSSTIQVTVHEVEADGLPDMSDGTLEGRVALISEDGIVVSGWPKLRGPGQVSWEADPDVGCCTTDYGNVTHWLELPVPAWELTGG